MVAEPGIRIIPLAATGTRLGFRQRCTATLAEVREFLVLGMALVTLYHWQEPRFLAGCTSSQAFANRGCHLAHRTLGPLGHVIHHIFADRRDFIGDVASDRTDLGVLTDCAPDADEG